MACRHVYSKLLHSAQTEVMDRRVQIASFIIAHRFFRYCTSGLRKQGPTQQFRYRNVIRNAVTLQAAAQWRVNERRAKSLLSHFLIKCGQTMQFKVCV